MMADILEKLTPLVSRVNETITNLLAEDEELVAQVGRYNFNGGGKRLRPLLFCLGVQALGRELTPEFLEMSASFEFLHMATLIHDDIVDLAETRRGRAAAHLVFGVPEAVLVGDYFLAKAAQLGARGDNIRCTRIMARVVADLSLGELSQLQSWRRTELTAEEYFKIIHRKTAVLIEGATETAAVLAGGSEADILALSAYGRELGLAFQIVDDVLDYEGEGGEFGKPVGHDLEEGKITLPFILARAGLDEAETRRLTELAGRERPEPEVVAEAAALVRQGRGPALALAEAGRLAEKAVAALAGLADTPARADLAALARRTVHRRR